MSYGRGSSTRGIRAAHEHFRCVTYARLGSRYALVWVVADAIGLLAFVLFIATATWPLRIDM